MGTKLTRRKKVKMGQNDGTIGNILLGFKTGHFAGRDCHTSQFPGISLESVSDSTKKILFP